MAVINPSPITPITAWYIPIHVIAGMRGKVPAIASWIATASALITIPTHPAMNEAVNKIY
jgi:hypothetical protein